MAGARIEIDSSDLHRAEALFDRIIRELGSPDELLDAIGAIVETQTRRRISDGGPAPDGDPWPELSEDWEARKAKTSTGGLLVFEGDLLDSLTYAVTGNAVEVGTNDIKAATHQFGDDDRGIPARPYLGLSDQDEAEIIQVARDFLDDLITP